MNAVRSEVSGEIAAVLAPAVAAADGRAAEIEFASPQLRHLWSLLSGYPKIRSLARFPDDELEEDLAREVERVLHGNRPLQARVAQLLAEEHGARTA
jgi:hypothetical protein